MLIPVTTTEGTWPVTVAGWVALGGVFVSLIATVFTWGRWTNKVDTIKENVAGELEAHKAHVKNVLDGFGGRVENMESEHDNLNGRLLTTSDHVQRLLGQHDSILELLGEAKGSSVQCREDTIALGEKIERKMDGITTKMGGIELNLSERLKGVETKLDFMLKESRP